MTNDELPKLSQLLDEKLQPLAKRLTNVEQNMATEDDLKQKIQGVKKDLKGMEDRLTKKFNKLFDFLDKDVMENKRRLRRVVDHVGLPPPLH